MKKLKRQTRMPGIQGLGSSKVWFPVIKTNYYEWVIFSFQVCRKIAFCHVWCNCNFQKCLRKWMFYLPYSFEDLGHAVFLSPKRRFLEKWTARIEVGWLRPEMHWPTCISENVHKTLGLTPITQFSFKMKERYLFLSLYKITYPAAVYMSKEMYWSEGWAPISVHCKGVSAACIPGPTVKPTLWKAEAIDIWAVRSEVKVAAAI